MAGSGLIRHLAGIYRAGALRRVSTRPRLPRVGPWGAPVLRALALEQGERRRWLGLILPAAWWEALGQ